MVKMETSNKRKKELTLTHVNMRKDCLGKVICKCAFCVFFYDAVDVFINNWAFNIHRQMMIKKCTQQNISIPNFINPHTNEASTLSAATSPIL